MRTLSGRELAESLGEIRPGIRTAYMSGYTNNAVALHGILEKETHFLQKPFTEEAIARKVREALDGNSTAVN